MKVFVSPRAVLRKDINKGGGTCGFEGSFDMSGRFDHGHTMYIPEDMYEKGAACGACFTVSCSNAKDCQGPNGTTMSITARVVGLARYTSQLQLSDVSWDGLVADRKRRDVDVQFKKVLCNATSSMAVRVVSGSKKSDFGIQILGAGGLGIGGVEISNDGNKWVAMERKGGAATWTVNRKDAKDAAKNIVRSGKPMSVRVTAANSGEKIVLDNIIPAGWTASRVYMSKTNFHVAGAKPWSPLPSAVLSKDSGVDKAKVESAIETIKTAFSKASTEVSAAAKSALEALKGVVASLEGKAKDKQDGKKSDKKGTVEDIYTSIAALFSSGELSLIKFITQKALIISLPALDSCRCRISHLNSHTMALSRYPMLLVVFAVALAAHLPIGASALHGVGQLNSLRASDDASKSSLSMLPARALSRRALKDGATTADLGSPLKATETDSESVSIEDSDLEDVLFDGGVAEIGGDARRGLRGQPQNNNNAKKRGEDLAKKAAEKAAKKALEYGAKKALTSAGGSAVGGVLSIVGAGDGPTMLGKVGADLEKTGNVGRVIGKVMQNKVVNAVLNTVAPKPLMTGLNIAAEHYDDIKREGEKVGKAVGHELNKAGNAVKNGVNKAGNAVKNEVNKAGNAVKNEVNKAGNAVKNEVNKAGNAVKNEVNKAGNAVKNEVNKAGRAVGDAAKKAWGGIAGLFKRK
ncbi:unnamed protein product [Closterium sp. Yama58-4]|nr:unnamed protein product [Closterium sp. Yama58-4]